MKISGAYLTLHGFDDQVDIDPRGELQIDLARLQFIEPYGLVSLAAATHAATRYGVPITVTAPIEMGTANYLSRLHLSDHLDRLGIEHCLPTVNENPLPEQLAELCAFTSYGEAEDLAGIVYRRLEEATPTFGLAAQIYEALAEVCNNAVEHAQIEHGYAAAQVYNRGKQDQRIDFAIGDGGIGIKESLSEAGYAPTDDTHAIRLALTSDVTSSREQGRGHGLPDTCQTVLDARGTFGVRSGNTRVLRTANREAVSQASGIPGTVVGASIPCGIH